MLYGKPTKLIRHVDEDTFTIEPQRFYVHLFWLHANAGYTPRTDGLDLQDEKIYPLGSRVTKHKLDILVTPETIEPQQCYIGRIKLAFNDVLAKPICGGEWYQASYQDTATENFTADANDVGPQLFPQETIQAVQGSEVSNLEIGGSGSGDGIKEFLLDDNIKKFIRPKKVTVFDQRPLMGERWQRIPSKVKRINPFTFYGLWIFNDSTRGATPADTQLTFNIKSYIEEWAI